MSKRNISVVTSSRADFGLLFYLLKEIDIDPDLELTLIVTGSHLSEEFGLTYKEIEKDFYIHQKIDILNVEDSAFDIIKSMTMLQELLTKQFTNRKPDILVLLGDRYEIFSAAIAALICNVPIAHLHGGERSEGVIDEALRHSITKMSHFHFVAHEDYKKRVIQLGESPERVFNVGALGLDNIKKIKLISRNELEKKINFSFNKRNILVAFHPLTLEEDVTKKHFSELLKFIGTLEETNVIFTKSNIDSGGRMINKLIDEYVSTHKNTIAFASLGQSRYLNVLAKVDALVGNSSSGILEAPALKVASINIGDRQRGRIFASSVINCDYSSDSISEAFVKLYSKKFQKRLQNTKNPFGDSGASKKIHHYLKSVNLNNVLKKSFYDT